MITEKDFLGRGQYLNPSGNVTLTRKSPRFITVVPQSGGLFITLPSTARMKTGGPHFRIANIGVHSITVRDSASNNLATVAANQLGLFSLISKATSQGTWIANVIAMQGSPNAKVKTFSVPFTIGTAFAANLSVGAVKPISVSMGVATGFAANLFKSNEKQLKTILQIGTVFTAQIGSFPVANIVSASATGSGDGTLATPWTLKQAAQTLTAGQTCYLRGGTYAASASHMIDSVTNVVNNGSAGGGYITFKAYPNETPILTGTNRIKGSEYLRFDGITFRSSGNTLVSTTTTPDDQNHFEFLNCTFDAAQGAGSYTGVLLENGTHYLFRNCTFKDWWNGDQVIFKNIQYILVEDCDFSQSRNNHNCIGFTNCSDGVIRRCIFRNPWDRAVTIRQNVTTARRCLIEDCAFLDVDWDGVSFHPEIGSERGATEAVRFTGYEGIFRNNLIIGHNGGKAALDPIEYAYAGALQQHLYDAYNIAPYNRYYNNVVHRSRLHAVEFLYNSSAGLTVNVADLRFKNNSISTFGSYGINVANSTMYPWEGYQFKYNRIHDPAKTKVIFLQGEGIVTYTVTEAQTAHSSVFQGNITNAPQYNDEPYYNAFDANPALYDLADLPTFFAAFSEPPSAPTQGMGTELATITANSTGTTLTVDDAHWFFAGNQLLLGDEIIVGTNAAVRVTAKPTATTLTINSSITVSIGDKVYLKRMTKMPNIGTYGFSAVSNKEMQVTLTEGTAFTAVVKRDARKLQASMTVGTTFAVNITKGDDFYAIDHETGDFSQYTSSTTGGGDLSVHADAAMNSTSYGLKIVINDTGAIYGLKSFPATWTTDYLRIRLYLNINTIAMTNSDDLYLVQFRTGSGQVSGYLRLKKTSGTFRIYAAQRDDGGVYTATADYTITSGANYVEIEFKRASSNVASDGTTKIWVNGTLHDTKSGLDVFDVTRPVDMVVGALSLEATTTGTVYVDQIRVRTDSTFIGAS